MENRMTENRASSPPKLVIDFRIPSKPLFHYNCTEEALPFLILQTAKIEKALKSGLRVEARHE